MSDSQIAARENELFDLVSLQGRQNEAVRRYSKGMRQRLGLAQAMLHDPDLLILDEPTDGLDPMGRSQIRDVLDKLKQRGKTVFLNSHILQEVELICDRVAIMDEGRIISIDTPSEMIDSLIRSGFERQREVKAASLEDVFIHLTGHEMRED
jgi:ABC-2 type transport system ATP-binding protein